ncbi:MAG: hypothetical protein JO040_10755, partial [Gemmatimonadetes bacterium]|nr:hypothetical protein [Gemmatimonadota bacterium]
KEEERREREYRRAQAERQRQADRAYRNRRSDDWAYRDREGRYDSRSGRYNGSYGGYGSYGNGSYGRYGNYGSYNEAHRAFHRSHDLVCRQRASQRPYDPSWQLRVRSECNAEHNRWHDRMGIRHDGRTGNTSRWY